MEPDSTRLDAGKGQAHAANGLATVWGLRLLVAAGIASLCIFADSWMPALGFALAWFPNYPLLGAVMVGALRLPRFLDPVHLGEATLYRWMGVGLVKEVVTTRAWLMLVGFEPYSKLTDRRAFLERTELFTKGAEMCHLASFLFPSTVAVFCLVNGGTRAAIWILVFNIALNGYPVMLQRSNRWRIHRLRVNP